MINVHAKIEYLDLCIYIQCFGTLPVFKKMLVLDQRSLIFAA